MKNIYLASPFFSDLQKDRIETVLLALGGNDTVGDIYVPMEHQLESEEQFSFPWQVGVFKQDVQQVRGADVVVAITDYKTVDGEVISDPGTSFEIGLAYGANVPVVLVSFEETTQFNLMLAQGGSAFFEGDNILNLRSYDFVNMPANFTEQKVF